MCHWYLVVNLGCFTKCFCEHSCTYIFSDYLLCFLRVHRVESLDNLKAINLLLYKTSISSPRKYTFIILFFNISESLIHSSISEKFMHITHHHSTHFSSMRAQKTSYPNTTTCKFSSWTKSQILLSLAI